MTLIQSGIGQHRFWEYTATAEELPRINAYMRRKGLKSPFQDRDGMFCAKEYKLSFTVARDLHKTINGGN